MGKYRRLILCCVIVFLLVPGTGMASIGRWTPTIVDYEADLEVYGTYRNYKSTTDDVDRKESRLLMKERINFTLTGFVYHPRFIQYRLGLSGGLAQENFTNDSMTYHRTGSATGLNLRATILPMHPYNLELFFLRYEPLSPRAASSGPNPVGYSKGAIFKYENKPYFLNVSYINSTRESALTTSDWTSYMANATYFKQYINEKSLSLSGSLRRTESSSSSSPDTSTGNSASLSGSLSSRTLSAAAGLRYSSSDSGSVSSDAFSLTGSLALVLPWHFRAQLGYSFSKSDSENLFTGDGQNMTSKTHSINFSISHKLYRSLASSFGIGFKKTDSTGGTSKSLSNQINIGYTKNIPGGILRSGIGISRTSTDKKGPTATIDVPFRQTVPRRVDEPVFRLEDEDVDKASITLFLLDPDVPEQRIRLEEGTHYTVTPFGNTFEIEIIAIPFEYQEFFEYDFLVSYKSRKDDAEFERDTLTYRLSVDLLNTFYPYYRHHRTKQTVSSGFMPGGDYEIATDTAGLQVVLMPFRFLATYTRVKSDIVPYKAWGLSASYQKDLNPTTRVNARVEYTDTSYPEGTSGNGIAYSEQRTGGVLGMVKRFPKRGVSLSASGSYWQRTGLSDSKAYSLNSSLGWKMGKFVFEVGASVNFTKSISTISTTDRTSQNYYLHIRRKLF